VSDVTAVAWTREKRRIGLSSATVNDLQAVVGAAADEADAHSTAPILLLRAQAALGELADSAEIATGGGRTPFRVPDEWSDRLGQLAYIVYLLADQTGVVLDSVARAAAEQVSTEGARRRAETVGADSNAWI
jgi:hypothetical protein